MTNIDRIIVDGREVPIDSSPSRLDTIEDHITLLRDIVKIQDIHNYLYDKYKHKNRWHKLCASMDVMRDSWRAVEEYNKLEDVNFIRGGSLYFYGVLNALYMQQDAIIAFSDIIYDTKIDLKKDYADTFCVRQIRDNVCHATNRNGSKQIFISPTTVGHDSFQYLIFTNGETPNTQTVNLKLGIENQIRDVKTIILLFCRQIINIAKENCTGIEAEIDQMLYTRYNLTPDEIAIIEK